MSAATCEIIGTGDGKLKNLARNEGAVSKTIAKNIVLEIVDNALDLADDTCRATNPKTMDKISVDQYKGKHVGGKEKSTPPLKGTGDQKSNESFERQEPIPYHPPVEKKSRLTDLVRNSKQILAKIMMTDSKMNLSPEEKKDEEVVKVIELDCVKMTDLPFKIRSKILPEEVPLPENDLKDSLSPSSSEDRMEEIGLSQQTKEATATEKKDKKRMTFPRASGSKAKAAFTAKCRTLKREATNLKKKKWDVGGKIANFFRKRRESIEQCDSKTKETQVQKDNAVGSDEE